MLAVVELLCRVALGHLFQMGRLAGSIIEGPHPLSGRGEFRSFATLNVAWNGLVRLLRVVPEDCRPAIMQLKGRSGRRLGVGQLSCTYIANIVCARQGMEVMGTGNLQQTIYT